MNEQPPKKLKTQEEINAQKKRMVDSFSPALTKKMEDLGVRITVDEVPEKKEEGFDYIPKPRNLDDEISFLGKELSGNSKKYTAEEKQEMVEEYLALLDERKKRDAKVKPQDTTMKQEEQMNWPKGRVNFDGEKISIEAQENTNKDPDIVPHTKQWGVDVEKPLDDAQKMYQEFLSEDNASKNETTSTSQIIREVYPHLDAQPETQNQRAELPRVDREEEVVPPIVIHNEAPQVERQNPATPHVEDIPTQQPNRVEQRPIQNTTPEEIRVQRTEMARQLIPAQEVRKLMYQIVNRDMDAKNVPEDFQIPESYNSVVDGALLFLLDKKQFEDKCKEMKEVKNETQKNDVRIWRDNYEKILGKSIDRLKLSLHEKFVKEKSDVLTASGQFSAEEIRLKMKQEALEHDAGVIFRLAIPLEAQITKTKVESELSEKDMKLWQKALAKYRDLPQWQRLGVSVAVSAGIGAGVVLAGTGAIAAAATYGAARAAKTFAGGAVSAGLRGLSERFFGKKYDKKREVEMKAGEKRTLEKLKAQVATWEQQAQEWDRNEENKLKLMRIVDDSAIDTNTKLGLITAKENKSKRIATIASGLIGGGLVLGLSTDWNAVFAGGHVPGAGEVGKQIVSPEAPGTHIEDLAVAHKGDSVWTLIEENAEKNIKGFSGLNEAQKTYFIDHLKDQVAADPHKFGLENADQIQIGYGKELGQLFENNQDIQQTLESAKHLTKGQMDGIMHSNAAQRAALFESVKPKVPTEVTGMETDVPVDDEFVEVDGTEVGGEVKLNKVIEGVDPYGVKTQTEVPAELMQDKELAQSYMNYMGSKNFAAGSQVQEWAQQDGAENLVKLTEQHPEYLKIDAVRDALREIHTNNIVEELHEGGAFKFLNSADHEDLFREVKGMAKTYGFDSYRAESFADYVSQINEMNEETLTPFIDGDTGSFIGDKFTESISHFNELAKSITPPEIPEGATSSLWEPRLLSPANGGEPIVGLVRQSSPNVFELKVPTGTINSGLNYETVEKMIVKPPSLQK